MRILAQQSTIISKIEQTARKILSGISKQYFCVEHLTNARNVNHTTAQLMGLPEALQYYVAHH